eukprot:NODE_1281_length_2032_cov_122.313777_g1086_i0.p1 GENE.NODE_1281_length_2032_cov_122.313777_g1086_i0~~NODE_1281_length_2032_cov_122.313777_g1086_i0.p1  ORF type:complete len:593 (-),score=46.34 NODE_1281_length_2032_cov_122.313777_g1086_i0:169-1947(-)
MSRSSSSLSISFEDSNDDQHIDNTNEYQLIKYPKRNYEIELNVNEPSTVEGDGLVGLRKKLFGMMFNRIFNWLMFILLAFDFLIALMSFYAGDRLFGIIDIMLLLGFVNEILARAYVWGFSNYFLSAIGIVNMIELLLVLACIAGHTIDLFFKLVNQSEHIWKQPVALVILGLRPIRLIVMIYLRVLRSRTFGGSIGRCDQRRFKDGSFDLDLTYITTRIIAMSWPGVGMNKYYRNDVAQVRKFLDKYHRSKYRIYNLSSEKAYDPAFFRYRVRRFMLERYHPCDLLMILDFCLDVRDWLEGEEDNVAAIHCKSGKGRSGLLICSFLMFSGFSDCATHAMNHFGILRSADDNKSTQAVDSPSQGRYIKYFEDLIRINRLNGKTSSAWPDILVTYPPIEFQKVTLRNVPSKLKPNAIFFAIIAGSSNKLIYVSEPSEVEPLSTILNSLGSYIWSPLGNKHGYDRNYEETSSGDPSDIQTERNDDNTYNISFQTPKLPPIVGDIRIDVYKKKRITNKLKKYPSLFFTWLNPYFVRESPYILTRVHLDGLHNIKNNSIFGSSFAIELHFLIGDDKRSVPSENSTYDTLQSNPSIS